MISCPTSRLGSQWIQILTDTDTESVLPINLRGFKGVMYLFIHHFSILIKCLDSDSSESDDEDGNDKSNDEESSSDDSSDEDSDSSDDSQPQIEVKYCG